MDFLTLPEGPVTLKNLTAPGCLLGQQGDLVSLDLSIAEGHLTDAAGQAVDMAGAMVFPAFVDMHTHLDKGHIWPRAPNPDGSFDGALRTVAADRSERWSADDLAARMDFALRCAYAHGTRAIRTHLDSIPPQDEISWLVFKEIRQAWKDRIALQAACLVGCDSVGRDTGFPHTADLVAEAGGILGMVAYPVPDIDARVRLFLTLAKDRGLEADFHVDETLDPSSETLRVIAEAVLETGFEAPVTVGHLCSLSAQAPERAASTMDLVAEAGLNVVSLPMCNLYLQDRQDGTPRMRGITLVHELKARGVNVSFASDNTRDPFYAYGDLDMIEVMREATRIGHLDHAGTDWARSFTTNPAAACGFAPPRLAPGASADLVICRARNWTELFARPQADRIVIRAGVQIDRTLPDYAELDHLMRTQ
ncbi:cytosine deaminase [Roseobacter sinensis]|uniref:Cytosine deaminase n=1 Tax=Roseobacter sinensis TaxID=2931391 RepID=A0ABT3BIB8_9RHOB|nr:cytosine deaminase [Roseobacter sp. WL0113]MCV3273129.1 cytosine deaminase [Roseobacter sp. WL0113]